jgi:hypothetical protein
MLTADYKGKIPQIVAKAAGAPAHSWSILCMCLSRLRTQALCNYLEYLLQSK